MDRTNGAEGTLVWPLCSRQPLRGYAPSGTRLGIGWGILSLAWGAAVLVPVMLLSMLLGMIESPGRADAVEFVAVWTFSWIFAMIPAVTGGLVYLPVVCWAAERWPRAGRAIALACTPIVALGVVPWGMEEMLLVWNVGAAAAAGLVFWAATLPLPALASAREVEGRRMGDAR